MGNVLCNLPPTGQPIRFVDVVDDKGTMRLTVDVAVGAGVFMQAPPKSYVYNHIGQQVNTAIIIPTTGKKLKIYGVQVDSNVTNVCCAEFNFVSSVGQIVWRVFFDKAKAVQGWMPLNITGGIDESLVLNTIGFAADSELFVSVAYDEVI